MLLLLLLLILVFDQPAKQRRRSLSGDGGDVTRGEVVDRLVTGEIRGVDVGLVDSDQQLDGLILRVHRRDVEWRVAAVRLGVHSRCIPTAHQQLDNVRPSVLGGPVQCRVASDEVSTTGQSCAGTLLRESVKCCIKGLGRLDLVHILALQKLKFWHSLRHSSNMTMYNMYLFMSRADEYNMLLARYTCFTSDSAGRLRFNIDKHFADVCAVREACK